MTFRPDPKPAKREKAPPKRLRAKPKPPRTDAEREASERFRRLVLALDRACILAELGGCEGPLQVHHCVSQQQLRHAGRDDLRWAAENGTAVCERHHRRHSLAVERIPLARLPRRCVAFTEKHGFEDILARYYPSSA